MTTPMSLWHLMHHTNSNNQLNKNLKITPSIVKSDRKCDTHNLSLTLVMTGVILGLSHLDWSLPTTVNA